MTSSKIIAVLIAVISLVWFASAFLLPSNEELGGATQTVAEKAAETSKELVEVRVRSLKAQLYADDVLVTGRTGAVRSVELKVETEGQVEALSVEEGARVEKGELLVTLETRDRAFALKEAQDRLKQREIEYKAAKNLETKGYNSKVRLAQALADLENAKTALKQKEIDLEKTKIRAPFKGIVFEQNVEEGDYLSIGSPVFTIVDLDPIEFTGYVSERLIQDLSLGAKAKANFLDGREAEGVLSYIAPAADPRTRTFRIIIQAPNPDLAIKEGLTAELRIDTSEKEAYKISPSILSLNEQGQMGVKIVDDSDTVRFVEVAVLAHEPQAMWVTGPPKEARFITVGQEYVLEGQKVKPVQATGDGLL